MSTEKLKTKDLPALETLRICSNCIQEKYLKDQVSRTNIVAECAYCKEHNPTISLGDLADLLETAIDTHYWFCHRGEVSEWDVETMSEGTERFGWDTPMLHVEDLIASVARIKPAPAEQVRKVLNIRYCGSDPGPGHDEIAFERGSEYYRRAPKSDEFSALWNSFEHSLKTETRHFNHAAEDKLRTIFAGVEQLSTRDGKPVVVTAGPGERLNAFFRARLFQSERVLAWALQSPETSLGPPPRPDRPGRMNARGISLFYGATSLETAIAEVRPLIEARVLTGSFHLVRPIRLLDIEALRSVFVDGSLFDPLYTAGLRKALFLTQLSQRISQPVMPDDEADEYLITQAIADYLANLPPPGIDGIIYPSVQKRDAGSNIALFHKSSSVEIPCLPQGTRVEVAMRDLERGPYNHYSVTEIFPAFIPPLDTFETPDSESEPVTLRLNRDSLAIHIVKSLSVESDPFKVVCEQDRKPPPWEQPSSRR